LICWSCDLPASVTWKQGRSRAGDWNREARSPRPRRFRTSRSGYRWPN